MDTNPLQCVSMGEAAPMAGGDTQVGLVELRVALCPIECLWWEFWV